jgi:predicted site-specific integrase-resolvase
MKFYRLIDASKLLGLSPKTLRRWCQTGIVACCQAGPRSPFLMTEAQMERLASDLEVRHEA